MVKNESEIIELIQNKQTVRQGFERIVKAYGELLYWQIRRMVLVHQDANDVLQNTFLKAWKSIGFFRAEAKLSTWLYRIAFNESIDFLNEKRKISKVAIDDPELSINHKLESDPYFHGHRAELLLHAAIQTLPDKQHIVFNLRYYEEMPYQEMSEVLGTSVGALKASFHHASKKVEEFLQEHD